MMGEGVSKRVAELQEAITALEAQRGVLGDSVVDSSISALQKEIAELQPAFTEERKLVTCLFCDVVESSRMASDRDPEEVLRIIDGALREMVVAVEAYGGTVTRFMGDGMLAVFGAPKALERHAEQAIRAGLGIQERIKAYAVQVEAAHGLASFRVRVGINTGHVVGGELAGAPGEYTVIGDTVNMAARFEAAAPTGGVLVGENTFQLAGGESVFEADAWEPIEVKGSPEPLAVYQIIAPLAGGRVRAVARAPLTGRDAELMALQERFERVVAERRPQVVTVVGPAGIGKSRLRLEFEAWLDATHPQAPAWVGRAFSYTRSTPYALASSALQAALGFAEADSVEQRRAKLEAGWQAAGDLSEEHLHGLAAMLTIDYEESVLAGLEPQARRGAIFDAFAAYCARRAATSELVLIMEDTHWADDLSLDLLESLIGSLPDAPLLLVVFTRPVRGAEARPLKLHEGLSEDAYREIQLADLTDEQTGELVRGLLDLADVPETLIEAIADKAQGNPFFVEELVNVFIEQGALTRQNGGWQIADELSGMSVPDTVQDVLAARIDRLSPEDKHVIQHAAIVGRNFFQQLLTELLEQDVSAQLGRLNEREFVSRLGRAALVEDWEWVFRHVLVQEVAYESVLREVRREVHRQIAEWMEANASERVEELAPVLARHYERGKVWDKAVQYLATAADRSARVFAMQEALRFYDEAIALSEKYPEAVEPAFVVDLHERRGDARGLVYEFEGAESDLRFVLNVAREAEDSSRQQSLLVRLGYLYRTADRLDEAVAHLEDALAVARESGDQRSAADALYHLGTVAWSEGNNAEALGYQQEAVDICRALGLTDLVAVQALHGLAEARQFGGDPGTAIDLYWESIELSRQIGDKSYESENLYMLSSALSGVRGIGDNGQARETVDTALSISRAARMDGHTAPALLMAGLAYGGSGDYRRGLAFLDEAFEWGRKLGITRFLTAAHHDMGYLLQQLNLLEMSRETHASGVQMALDSNIFLVLPGLQAALAIDRVRLGDLEVEHDLKSALSAAHERGQGIQTVRCLEGLIEWALASGMPETALTYADELEQEAEPGNMRDFATQARRYRGEALTALGQFEAAESELQAAAAIADHSGGVRLTWDVHAVLAAHYHARGDDEAAAKHDAMVREVVGRIAENLQDPELRAGLPKF